MLEWKDAKGLLLTEEAFFKGFKYQVFWGMAYEQDNARIYQGDKIAHEYSNGNRNFGNKYCKNFCERHAWKQLNPIEKIYYFFKKRISK